MSEETKVAEEAPKAAPNPLEEFAKSRGYTPEQIQAMVEQVEYINTPAGEKAVADAVAKKYGHDIAKQVLLEKPDDVLKGLDSRGRRHVRRFVARQDEAEDDPEPDPAVEAKAAVEATEARLGKVEATARAAVEAVQLAPKLVAFATSNETAAKHYEQWQAEVLPLLKSGHPRYQGPQGIEHAHDDVVAGWRSKGEMAGLKPAAAASPTAASTIPVHKDEDIVKQMTEARAKGKEALLAQAVALGMDLAD